MQGTVKNWILPLTGLLPPLEIQNRHLGEGHEIPDKSDTQKIIPAWKLRSPVGSVPRVILSRILVTRWATRHSQKVDKQCMKGIVSSGYGGFISHHHG